MIPCSRLPPSARLHFRLLSKRCACAISPRSQMLTRLIKTRPRVERGTDFSATTCATGYSISIAKLVVNTQRVGFRLNKTPSKKHKTSYGHHFAVVRLEMADIST